MFRIDRNYVHLATTRFAQLGNSEAEADTAADQCPDVPDMPQQDAQAEKAASLAQEITDDANAKAKRIIMDARDEVAALLLSARDQAEEGRRLAWQEGFAEGTEEGRRSFDEQLSEKLRLDDESLKRVLDELYSERMRMYSELEDEIVGLALGIVRKVINPAEEELGSVFDSLIRNALKQINPDSKVVIRVSPVEYERFFASGSAVFELDSGVAVTASILRDVSLEEGDCIIDTEDALFNAGIDSQLKYIQLAFGEYNA